MSEEEKQPVDVSKQPIVFFMVVSVSLIFCFCLFKYDVLRTNIFFISSFCLFVKTNRGRFLCVFGLFSAKQFVWVKPYRFLLLYCFFVFALILWSEFLFLFLC